MRLNAADAEQAGLAPTPLVVVALGGYGRSELHPSSDIDLMVVYDGELSPFVQRVTQELLYTLWDLGLQVGHSLRSLEDCVAMARTDFPSRTSMQQARLIDGDRRFFAKFGRALRDNVLATTSRFLAQTLPERDQRTAIRCLTLHRRSNSMSLPAAARPHTRCGWLAKFGRYAA